MHPQGGSEGHGDREALGEEPTDDLLRQILDHLRDSTAVTDAEIRGEDARNEKRLRNLFAQQRSRPHVETDQTPTGSPVLMTGRPHPDDVIDRESAISYLVAIEASDLPVVQNFRTTHLGEELLGAEEVGSWIREQDARDWEQCPEEGTMDICWQTRDASHFSKLRVPPGGVLEELAVLVESLAWPNGWERSQATLFVLTGLTPVIRLSRADITTGKAFPALRRIVLEVDPALTPAEIESLYRSIRNRYIRARPRALSAKHIALAVAAARKPDSVTWEELKQDWNKVMPRDLRYLRPTKQFTRDATRARQRLLKPSYLKEPKDS